MTINQFMSNVPGLEAVDVREYIKNERLEIANAESHSEYLKNNWHTGFEKYWEVYGISVVAGILTVHICPPTEKKQEKPIEARRLYSGDLRRLCISKNWYTNGDNKQYANLLNSADNKTNITTADIITIAQDIKNHSDTEYPLSSICFEVAEICHSFFDGLEEAE